MTITQETTIPGILGTPIPILGGNPYTLTKGFYDSVLRPSAITLLPSYQHYLEATVLKGGEFIQPVIDNYLAPNLSKVGFTGLRELEVDGKGNTIILNLPENEKTVIVGKKVGEMQEFDVFVARVCQTVKYLHMPVKEEEEIIEGEKVVM